MEYQSGVFFTDEQAHLLLVNAKKLLALGQKHLIWAESHRADPKDVLNVNFDLMVCVMRFESCIRNLTEEEQKEYGTLIQDDDEK